MQNALIVDDSKVARYALGKALGKLNIAVDMVESGEQALDYLRDHIPSIIFMDHMMPGMDGFQAVKAIKSDPQRAHIPIVMHTTRSEEGELYIGQARALGAADILPKPAEDEELRDVLARLQETADATNAAEQEADVAYAVEAVTDVVAVTDDDSAMANTADIETIEPAFAEPVNPLPAQTAWLSYRQLLFALLLLAPIMLLLTWYIPLQKQHDTLLEQQSALYSAIEWVANQSGGYDYGEAPMSGERLAILEGLVTQLAAAGFVGTIRLEGHIGEFCLTGAELSDGSFVSILPPVNMPLTECDTMNSTAAIDESGRQSTAFKAFLASSPVLAGSDIRVDVVGFGASQPVYDYPVDSNSTTAGDWNAVALSNNRVRYRIVADATAQ